MNWKTIDSAPKDVEVLIYSPVEGVRSSTFAHGIWQGGAWYADWRVKEEAKPTYWMKLPAPPSANETPNKTAAMSRTGELTEDEK